MKIEKTILILCVLFTIQSINSQSRIIKANPLGLIFGIANIGFEYQKKNQQSMMISGLYYKKSDITGFGLGIEHRFYFHEKETPLSGFYGAPGVGYLLLEDKYSNNASFISVSGSLGHQWILRENLAFDVFTGISFLGGEFEIEDSLVLGVGVALGFQW